MFPNRDYSFLTDVKHDTALQSSPLGVFLRTSAGGCGRLAATGSDRSRKYSARSDVCRHSWHSRVDTKKPRNTWESSLHFKYVVEVNFLTCALKTSCDTKAIQKFRVIRQGYASPEKPQYYEQLLLWDHLFDIFLWNS